MSRFEPTANDYALAWLRAAVGVLFLIFAQYKVFGNQFIYGGGFTAWIHQFLQAGAYPFMRPVLVDFVLPHARIIAFIVSYGELCIGMALVLGVFVRPASFFGAVYMGLLLLSSNYPGPRAPLWEYFGAALNHLVLALCFAAFGMSNAARVWSLPSYLRKKYQSPQQEEEAANEPYSYVSNTFGK